MSALSEEEKEEIRDITRILEKHASKQGGSEDCLSLIRKIEDMSPPCRHSAIPLNRLFSMKRIPDFSRWASDVYAQTYRIRMIINER